MIKMTSPRLSQFLYGIALTLISTSYVSSQDYITNETVVDVGLDFFTLEWEWVIDDADDFIPWGCQIVTRINDNSLRIVNEVVIEGLNTSYTVKENITSWELYRSCITPILTNGTVLIDGDGDCTDDLIQTLYDPWTWKPQIAVIVTGGLIFLLVLAKLINFKWPRDQKRTFTLDDDDLDEDDDVDGKTEPKDVDNLGFEQDEDATSSVNDWNAAAAVAVVEGKTGRRRDLKQWVKNTERQHQSTRLFHNLDVNQNSSHVQPESQPLDDDAFDDSPVGQVEEGVPAVETGNTNLNSQSAHQNQEPYHAIYHDQQDFSDDYLMVQGNQDGAVRDSAYQNYGYEDNEYGNDRYSQQNPSGWGYETHPSNDYDTTIPQLDDDYSQYF